MKKHFTPYEKKLKELNDLLEDYMGSVITMQANFMDDCVDVTIDKNMMEECSRIYNELLNLKKHGRKEEGDVY